jgi:pyridoxamine 5'-phosphate oxidase-like protein
MAADDIAAHARDLLDANAFLTLGTIDPDGRPWTSPVYFAASGLRDFYWSSEIGAVHSRNLTERRT